MPGSAAAGVYPRGSAGVIDNYIGWLRPGLHGLDDPQFPSLIGVLIVNTNLPVPSAWSRRRIEVEPLTGGDNPQS